MYTPKKIFEVYRYQILPSTDKFQFSLFLDEFTINSPEELVKKKNEIFAHIIRGKRFQVSSSRSQVKLKLENEDKEMYLFRMAAKRHAVIHEENFTKKDIPNWPNVWIVINNNPTIQKIAIEKNPSAFFSTHAVAEILLESINKRFSKYQLNLYIDKLKEKTEFWDTIKRFEGKITWLGFNLISPNMANISGKLTNNLRAVLEDVRSNGNSHKTALELNSPANGVLKIEKSNQTISSAVDYMTEGGGSSAVRIKSYKKKIQTTESIQEIELADVIFEGDCKDVFKSFKELL